MKLISIFLLSLFVSITACQQKKIKPSHQSVTTPANKQVWTNRMFKLSAVLSELLPYLTNYNRFNDPKNFATIEEQVSQLENLSHALDQEKMTHMPDADPSLRIMAARFEQDIQQAHNGLKIGQREYSRQLLRNVSNFCIQCHTRSSGGTKFPQLQFGQTMEQLPIFEQAEFFAATRQFDRAMEAYNQILGDMTLAQKDPFEWAKAARHALAISVRAEENPKQALQVAERVISNPRPTLFLQRDALVWKKEILAWEQNLKRPKNPSDQLRMAQQLIQRARKTVGSPNGSGAGDILYLRATGLLHAYLQTSKPGLERSQALLLLGQSYDALGDIDFWALHETYYELCIRETPHTKIAEACYSSLEESLYQGYTGSRGTFIPTAVQQYLQDLYRLAAPETKQ